MKTSKKDYENAQKITKTPPELTPKATRISLKLSGKAIFAWILFLTCLGLTVFFSCQSYSGSKNLTTSLASKLQRGVFLGIDAEDFHYFLRKFGHFVAHFFVGMFGFFAFWLTNHERNRSLAYILLLGVTVALLDELVQTIVAGRISTWTDGLINVAGVVSGSLIAKRLSRHKK